MSSVIKSSGNEQPFDEHKVYASVRSTLFGIALPLNEVELISDQVCKAAKAWLKGKQHVTTRELRAFISKALNDHNHTAAYLYSRHRNVS